MKHNTKTLAPFEPVADPVVDDFKSATFVISLLINLVLFISWIVVKVHGM